MTVLVCPCQALVVARVSGAAGHAIVLVSPGEDADDIGTALEAATRLVEGRSVPDRFSGRVECACGLCASLEAATAEFRRGVARVARRLDGCGVGR